MPNLVYHSISSQPTTPNLVQHSIHWEYSVNGVNGDDDG